LNGWWAKSVHESAVIEPRLRRDGGTVLLQKELLSSLKVVVAGAFASDPMEQSKAGYYADFILYPLLIVSLGVFEMGSAHKVPYLLSILSGFRFTHADDR
jgi:hypothetical protein